MKTTTMKKILLFLFTILSFSSYGQISKMGGMASRVNDSSAYVTNATVIQAHADGYHDIWLSNASNLYWVWNGSAYVNWVPSGGNFWKNAGTTNVTNPSIDFGTGTLLLFGGPTDESAIYLDGAADQVTVQGAGDSNIILDATGIDVAAPSFNISVAVGLSGLDLTTTAATLAGEDVNLNAGQTGVSKDINIRATNGHVHFTTGTAGILADIAGPITINTDPGTAGEYLKSNGAGAAPTWDTPAGGGGASAAGATGNIQYKSAGGGLQAEAALTYDSATNTLTVAELAGKYRIDQATPSTAGATVTIDMNSQIQRSHVGSASFATPKTFAMSNTTNSLSFQFTFTITDVAAVITVPSDWGFSPSAAWDGTDYTFSSTGRFVFGGDWDGTNWNIKVAGPFSN